MIGWMSRQRAVEHRSAAVAVFRRAVAPPIGRLREASELQSRSRSRAFNRLAASEISKDER